MKSIINRILSAALFLQAPFFVCNTSAGVLITGISTPDISTMDCSTNGITVVHSFSANTLTNADTVGYGIAIGNFAPLSGPPMIYFTAIGNTNHNQDNVDDYNSTGVYACPYGTDGSGGPDFRFLPHPDPYKNSIFGHGIQALATHNDILYLLTGFYVCEPLVYRWIPDIHLRSGGRYSGPIHIGPPALLHTNAYGTVGCPIGFTVLPNGDFLVQDYDGSAAYREYYNNGSLRPGGLLIDLRVVVPGNAVGSGYGVCVASDLQSLYFNTGAIIVQTDLSGNLLSIADPGITGLPNMLGITMTNAIPTNNPPTAFPIIQHASPGYTASTAAPAASSTLMNAQRSQQVYKSSQFPSDTITITALHFRPAEYPYGSAFSTTISNIQINLSTTANSPDGLSTTFANNVGADDTVVYSDSLTIASAYTGNTTGPRDSDIIIPLQEPFRYNPTNGNLLLDIRHFSDDSGNGAYTSAFDESDDAGSRVVSTNVNASTAESSDSTVDVVGFDYDGPNDCFAPNYAAYATSTNTSTTLVTTQRVQQVYQSLQFPVDSMLITELHFRPAEFPYGGAFSNTLGNIQINLSTTTNHPDGLSTTFSNNVGADDTVVYSGPLTISSSFTGNDSGPRDNDIVVYLQTPFAYFPANGNLLLDIRHFSDDSGNGAYTSMFKESDDTGSRVMSSDPNASTATSSDSGVDAVDFIYQGGGSIMGPNYAAFSSTSDASATFETPLRNQQVYGASQFPTSPVLIKELRFRPGTPPYGGAFSTTISNIQINLSTTTAYPDGLSTTFANNVGTNDTVVYSGSLSISSAYTGDDFGPRDNDIVVHLQTPFLYDSTKGNLLLDIRHFSNDTGNGAYNSAFGRSNDTGSRVVSTNPSASTATFSDTAVDVVKFIYSDE